MTSIRRLALNEFGAANAIYKGARVWVYTVDPDTLTRTTHLATLYDGPTGTGRLANPQNLSSDGKWTVIPYVEEGYGIVVNSLPFGEHDLGIVLGSPEYRGEWGPATIYQRGDTVRIGPAAEGGTVSRGNIYICAIDHTSGSSFANDLGVERWLLYIDVGEVGDLTDAAAASALDAAASEDAAAASAVAAAGSETAAAASATEAAATLLSFELIYLGPYAVDPTTDNDGGPLAIGMIYYNTASDIMKVWNGAAWDVTMALASPLGIAAGGTGAVNASAARTALGVAIGSDVQAHDAALDLVTAGLTVAGLDLISQASLDAMLTLFGFTAFGESLVAAADASATRTLLDLIKGTGDGNVPTFAAGALDLAEKILKRAKLLDISEAVQTINHSVSGALAIDVSAGGIVVLNQSANITSTTITGWPPTGELGSCTVFRVKDASGTTRSWVHDTSVDWPGGIAALITQTTGALDVLQFMTLDAGVRTHGAAATLDSK